MHYYNIVITPANGGTPFQFSSLKDSANGSTAYVGGFNGAALELDVDLFLAFETDPASLPYVRLKGVIYSDLDIASNFTNAGIVISLGMSIGLPLSNPQQAGQVFSGSILTAFSNKQGNEISLDLICVNGVFNPRSPGNFTFAWLKGESMELLVRRTLNTAFQDEAILGAVDIQGSYSSNLIFTESNSGYYYSLSSFAKWVTDTSIAIIKNPNYTGAKIGHTSSGVFILSDGSATPTTAITIQPTDIVGNLTWIDPITIQAKLVMRADIHLNDYVTFPANFPTFNTAGSGSLSRNLFTFSGTWLVTKIRFVGNSRHTDAESWVTIIDCINNVYPSDVLPI